MVVSGNSDIVRGAAIFQSEAAACGAVFVLNTKESRRRLFYSDMEL
jgi:hypothetical protein